MILVTNILTIILMLLVFAWCYPTVVETWIDSLFSGIERWLDRRADAAQSRLRERLDQVERQIAQCDEERAVLRWLQVVLVTLPVDNPGRQRDK